MTKPPSEKLAGRLSSAPRLNPGEVAGRFHATDWAQTALGPLDSWPQSLRAAVGICLNSRFPMFVWWGPALINIYNDAYAPMLGARHPDALGMPAQAVWRDIWPTIRPQVEAVMRRGEATWSERAELLMQRHGYEERAIFTWSYSPIIDEAGGVGGLFCACVEETPRMLAEQARDVLLSQVQSERARLANAFSQSPAFMGILNGPEHHVEFFNERFYQLVGRRGFVGKPVRTALPEVVSQGFVDKLDQVFRTGERYVGTAVRVELRRRPDRGLEEAFVDFVYEPLHDVDGGITGILVHGVDVTELNRRAVRDRFLVALDEAIRPLTGQHEIVAACTRLLGVHMNVDRCAFSLVEEDEDSYVVAGEYNRHTTALAGRRRLSDFGEEARRLLLADTPYLIADIDNHQPPLAGLDTYRGLLIQAAMAVPLFKERKLAAALVVHQSTPRAWRAEEVTLLRHVASRCAESLERARAARDLLESEARFRNMADFAPVMIWLTRADGSTEYLNERWYQFTGQTVRESTGFGWLSALHPDDRQEVERKFRAANSRGEPTSQEYRLRRSDGAYRWCADSATARRGADGRFLGYVGSVVDINDRKQIEESLAAEKHVLEMVAIGAALPDVLAEVVGTLERQSTDGAKFALLILQDEGERLVVAAAPGLPPAYRGATAALPSESASGAWRADDPSRRAFAEAAAEHGLHVAQAMQICGGDGNLLGMVAVFYLDQRDINDRDSELAHLGARLGGIVIERHQVDRRIAEALQVEQEARSQAERAGRVKDEFLATLSHELRTPLNAILGWVSVLKGSSSAQTVERGVEVIERNARSQARIIDDLLDMSAIISGKVRLKVRPVPLEPVVAAALDAARPAADAKRIRLKLNVGAQARSIVRGDADRLQQILWNLLSNAVKFTPPEGRIDVSTRQNDSDVEVEVSDNGEGIDPAFLPYVFDRFRQADASSTRRHNGLGLGLSIVRKLAELHGGSVRAGSKGLGQGSCFVLSLPVAGVHPAQKRGGEQLVLASEPAFEEDLAPAGHGGDPGRARLPPEDAAHDPWQRPGDGAQGTSAGTGIMGLRVLLVDDNQDSREVLARQLRDRGAEVDSAPSASAALRLLRASRYDVLVSDIGMPQVDGYQFLGRLRASCVQDGGATPAIALTAYAASSDRERALRAGYQLHLAKPVDAEELAAAIAGLAGRF